MYDVQIVFEDGSISQMVNIETKLVNLVLGWAANRLDIISITTRKTGE